MIVSMKGSTQAMQNIVSFSVLQTDTEIRDRSTNISYPLICTNGTFCENNWQQKTVNYFRKVFSQKTLSARIRR